MQSLSPHVRFALSADFARTDPVSALRRFCCRSRLKASANNDSLRLTRSAAGTGHDGGGGGGVKGAVLFVLCCRSRLKASANNDSLRLTRSAAGTGHDGSVGAGSRAAVLFVLPRRGGA